MTEVRHQVHAVFLSRGLRFSLVPVFLQPEKGKGPEGTRGGCLAGSFLVVAVGTALCLPEDRRHV